MEQKLQGVNECINSHGQQLVKQKKNLDGEEKKEQEKKIKAVYSCKMQPLFKQILSDREGSSFRPEGILDDAELCKMIADFVPEKITYTDDSKETQKVLENIKNVLEILQQADTDKIYIKNDRAITDISQAIFDEYYVIKNALEFYAQHENLEQDKNGKPKKFTKSQREKWLKKSYFSFDEIHSALKSHFDEYSKEELENQQESDKEGWQGITKEMKEKAINQPLFSYFKNLETTDKETNQKFNILEKIKETFESKGDKEEEPPKRRNIKRDFRRV